jgi:hypothetical protein
MKSRGHTGDREYFWAGDAPNVVTGIQSVIVTADE